MKNIRELKGKSIISFPNSFVVIDIETIGIYSQFDEIIELSAVKYCNNEISSKFSTLVKPRYGVPSYITDITGITNRMVSDSPDIKKALPQFMEYIKDYFIVGYNISFDINFIYDNCLKIGIKPPTNDHMDVLRLSRRILPGLENHKLQTVASHLEIKVDTAHRALDDCETTYKVLTKLIEVGIQQFESLEGIMESFKRKRKLKQKEYRAKSVLEQLPDNLEFDDTHPVFGKAFCFTGKLENFTRKEAMFEVAKLGGDLTDSVTLKTNYLVIGNFDFVASVKDNKSSKVKKAEKLMGEEHEIMIISENDFLDLISQ